MSVKDYKEGMIAGAKPFEEKFREIQNANIAAIQKLCCENSNSIGELIDIAEEHDNLLNYDWKKEYELSSYAEKAIFWGLFKYGVRIIEGTNRPDKGNQKLFSTYLCNKFKLNPLQIKEIEISKLKNNLDIPFQNLLYLSICNYFYIAYQNFKFEKKFDDEIFQYFRVSKNDKNEIHKLIEWTNNHLCLEKFLDFQEEINEEDKIIEESQINIGCSPLEELEDFTINELLFIKSGDEQIISSKKISFDANIKVCGKLIFKNCYIYYGLNDSIITIDQNGGVVFENCSFSFSNKTEKYFISSDGGCIFKNSLFEDCWALCDAKKIELFDSNIIFNEGYNFIEKSNSCNYLFNGSSTINNCNISGGLIVFSKEDSFENHGIFNLITSCEESILRNCIHPAYICYSVNNSKFYNCRNIFETSTFGHDTCTVKNSEFNECESIFNLWSHNNLIENSKFINCYNRLIEMRYSKLIIKECEFRNLKQKTSSSYILINKPRDNELQITKTIFDNLDFTDYGYLLKINGTMTEKEFCQIKITDCMFGKVYRKTPNPVIDSHVICVSYFISKQSSKKVLLSSNNTGIDDLLKQIEPQYNDTIINELETIVNEYLPRFGFTRYSKKEILKNKKAEKKFSTIKKLIPNLDAANVLGFADLTLTGSANEYLVFTNVQCFYHSSDRLWTYFYNHPELSSGYPIVIDDGKKRIFSLDEITVKNKDFGECITKLEAVLKETK